MNYAFYTKTALGKALQELFAKLNRLAALRAPVNVYLAGGMAVHLYTGNRVTTDVDAEFGARLFFPNDLMVEVTLEDGSEQVVYLDTNYNPIFGLMHEDYITDSVPLELETGHLQLWVLSPVDLAVSKITRFADNDKDDIASLVRQGLVTAASIEERALAAVEGFVGNQALLRLNVRDAVALARDVERQAGLRSSFSP